MATPKRRAAWSPVRLLPVIALALAICSAPAPSVVGAAPPGQGVRLRVFASLTDNLLRGTSEPEQLVEIVLDRSGTPGLARAEVLPPPGSYGWEVRLLDVGGHEVVPRTGDIISVRQGDRNATFVVPPLTARLDRAGDVVFGDTDPDLLVAGEVGGARGKPASTHRPMGTVAGAPRWGLPSTSAVARPSPSPSPRPVSTR